MTNTSEKQKHVINIAIATLKPMPYILILIALEESQTYTNIRVCEQQCDFMISDY